MKNLGYVLLLLFSITAGCSSGTDSASKELVLAFEVTDVSIHGGSDGAIDLTVKGGRKPYIYDWSNGEKTEDIQNLCCGYYKVVVTDSEGMSKKDSIEVKQPYIRILLLMDDKYGANYNIEDDKNNIKETFEEFGWKVSIAGVLNTLEPCSYGSPRGLPEIKPSMLVSNIPSISMFDCLCVMPGYSHSNLLESATVMDLIKKALDNGLVVSAWCKGVRVLAKAGVLKGKKVTGSASFEAEYETAGATYMGIVSPIIDGTIVTGVRSRFYRIDMCNAIKKAVEAKLSAERGDK